MSGCDSYGALFVIMIIVIVLAVVGIIVGLFWYVKKKKGRTDNYDRSKESSDVMGKEPLVEGEGEERWLSWFKR